MTLTLIIAVLFIVMFGTFIGRTSVSINNWKLKISMERPSYALGVAVILTFYLMIWFWCVR